MKTKKRQKICYNCNAQVDLEVIVCPYCGTDLLEEFDAEYSSEEDLETSSKSLSPQETIASLYPPLYQMHHEIKQEEQEKPKEPSKKITKSEESSFPMFFMAFSLYLLGMIVVLFFFSKNSEIHLKVNMKYLTVFFLFLLPAFFWSWKRVKED